MIFSSIIVKIYKNNTEIADKNQIISILEVFERVETYIFYHSRNYFSR